MTVLRASVGVSGATAAIGGLTLANRLGAVPLSSLAATPRAIGDGRLWLLATSALIADRPAVASLLGFAIVVFASLLVCGVRVTCAAAVLGHVVATLVVYGVLGVVWLVLPHVLESARTLADYGLSAMIAAWLGAIVAVEWRRRRGFGARSAVVALPIVALAIGLTLRPDLTVLDSEHVVAFALGIAAATVRLRRLAPLRAFRRRRRLLAAA